MARGTHSQKGSHTKGEEHGTAIQAHPVPAQPLQAHPREVNQASSRDLETPAQPGSPRTSDPGLRGLAFVRLLRITAFRRIWFAQVISNLGDWAYTLAVGVLLAGHLQGSGLVRTLALTLAAEGGTSALVGFVVAGPVADRFSRKRVMITADLVRGLAVGSLLFVGVPGVLHLVCVAACLGAFRAIFQPALMSSLPSVAGEDLLTANAVVTATFHAAIVVGPAIGALAVVAVGPHAAFALNAASFGVSALLLLGIHVALPQRMADAPWTPIRDLRDGLTHVVRSRVARGVAIAMSMALFIASWQGPLQVGIVRDVLASDGDHGSRALILGSLTASWGIGMVIGSALMPFAARRFDLGRLLAACIGIVGIAFVITAAQGRLAPVIAAWTLGGIASGMANVTYESLLQRSTPDEYLGRTFATVEAAQDAAYFLGALAVGALASVVAPATGLAIGGAAFLAIAFVAGRLLGPRSVDAVVVVDDVVTEPRDVAELVSSI